jgi:Fe-S-cluster containining protein
MIFKKLGVKDIWKLNNLERQRFILKDLDWNLYCFFLDKK